MSKKWKAKIEERQAKAAAAAKTMNGQNHIQFCDEFGDESTKSWKVKRK